MTIRTGHIVLTLLAMSFAILPASAQSTPEQKADSLLRLMTLDEKIGQMTQADYTALAGHTSDIATYALGSVLWGGDSEIGDVRPAGWLAVVDSFQAIAAGTRLRIPLLFGVDAVHGHNNVDGAVILPHNVGLGATRDPSLVERLGRVTAEEMLATGIQWTFAPCVAVARNERWGRTYESFGEDPALVAELGAAFTRGVQASSLADPSSVLACVKHYVGDGGTTDGVDQGNTALDEATLRSTHLPGYIESIRSGARSIMVSYNSWNGSKLHANKHLLTDVLKNELGFAGFLVSDWAAIDQLPGSYKAQIEASINAGLDMVMIPNGPGRDRNYREFIATLRELVKEGSVPMSRVDDAARRILAAKWGMNLFDRSGRDRPSLASVGSPAHRAVAREAVRKSVVLLKNEGGVLPLSKSVKRIHVTGRGADDVGMQCGGWTITWQGRSGRIVSGGTTILEAIRKSVGPSTSVTTDADGAGVAGADAAVVVVGEQPYAEMRGDSGDLGLGVADLAVIKRVKASGVPTVVILLSGRPMIIGAALESSSAFLAAWLPGTEAGGIADVLFGDYAPTGKLPHSWPRSMGQIPVNAGDAVYDPLFPFGFGLSYAR